MATKPAELYDQDFYAWTQEQAQALRTHFLGDNRLDVEHLAEEVADLGSSELHAVESYVENIMTRLLKLDYSSFDWPRNHGRREILAFRQSLQRRLTPSLRRTVSEDFDQRFANARERAASDLLESEPGIRRRLPTGNPYDWEAIEHHEDVRVVLAEQDAAADAPKRRHGKRKV
jgi:Domain of unknown function DUF29